MAYIIGSKIGKTPLFPRISPKKTWEGTIGGAICTVLISFGLSYYFNTYTRLEWLVIGVIIAIIGTIGDLIESMLKRSYEIKDSGNFLPGHGGFLDRFDSYIFALPFIWLALQLLR
jgi:phosphatidate cytidylyltransferase